VSEPSIPFLGTSWRERNGTYWRRRVLASLLLLLSTMFIGVFAVGFTVVIIGPATPVRLTLGVLYALTGLLGIRWGMRQVRAAPVTLRPTFGTRLLYLILAPASAIAVLTLFVASLGPEFLGERWAKQRSRS
jgi:hypothetical protein